MSPEPEADVIADVDPGTLGAYRAAGSFVAAAAGLSLLAALTTSPARSLRRRSAATWSLGCLAIGGAARLRPVQFAHAVRRRSDVAVPGLVIGGTIATLLSGGHRNPVYFSVVATTALAGGAVGVDEGGQVGALATGGYGLAVLATARPWSRDGQGVWWNASEAAGLWAAGRAGARIGDLALSLRSLETARRRERAVLSRVRDDETASRRLTSSAEEVRDAAERLRQSVLRLRSAAAREAIDDEKLAPALDTDIAGLEHLKLAPLLLRTEADQPVDLRAELQEVVDLLGADDVTTSLTIADEVPAVLRARQETVVIDLVKRAVDNSALHAPRRPVHIDVTLGPLSPGGLNITVEDDGGGAAPEDAAFGDGLTASRREVRELGGALSVTDGTAGVRVHATLTIEAGEGSAALVTSIADRVDETLIEIMKTLRLTTAVQSACQLPDGQTPRRALARLTRHIVLCLAGETAVRRGSNWGMECAAIGAALAFNSPGRPAGNSWPSILCTERALKDSGWPPLSAAVVAALIIAGHPRDAVTRHLGETLTERTFPGVAGVLGDVARRAGDDVVSRERELVNTIQQLALISEIERPLRSAVHDVLNALHRTPAWPALVKAEQQQRLPELADTREAEAAVRTAAGRLLEGLTVPISPVDMLVEQLRVQLWPTPLEVTGAEHLTEVEARRSGPSWKLDRARDRIWLIQLADGLAVALRRAFPVDALGRHRLHRAILSFEPAGREVVLSLRPIPTQPSRAQSSPDALARLARQLDGRLVQGYGDGLLSLRVRASAFAD